MMLEKGKIVKKNRYKNGIFGPENAFKIIT